MAIVTLRDGMKRELPLSAVGAGFVATAVEINGKDANYMLRMLEANPSGFRTWLYQFQARFPENRVPNFEEPTSQEARLIPAELLNYEAPDFTEADGYLLEAALQAGSVMLNDDGTVHAYKQEDLLRLIKCALNRDFTPLWCGSAVAAPSPSSPVEWGDWTVDDADTARQIMNYLGYGSDASREPGADRRRDKIAALIRARIDAVTAPAPKQHLMAAESIIERVENCVLFSVPSEYAGLADHAAFEAGQDNAIACVMKMLRATLATTEGSTDG